MPDITMCSNFQCPNAPSCYRIQATPTKHYQSIAYFEYTIDKNGVNCENYMPTHNPTTSNSTANL